MPTVPPAAYGNLWQILAWCLKCKDEINLTFSTPVTKYALPERSDEMEEALQEHFKVIMW